MKQFSIISKPSDHRSFIPALPAGLQALLPLIWSWMLLSLNPLYLIFFVPIGIGMAGLGLSTLARDLMSESSTPRNRFLGIFLIAASLGAAVVGAVMRFQPLGILISGAVLAFSLGVHFIASTYNYLKTPKAERTPLMRSNLITSGIKSLFQLGILAASICLFLIPGVNVAIGIAVLAAAFLYGAGFGSWEEERRPKLIASEFNSTFTNKYSKESAFNNTVLAKNSFTNTSKSLHSQDKSVQASSNPHAFYGGLSNKNATSLINDTTPNAKASP